MQPPLLTSTLKYKHKSIKIGYHLFNKGRRNLPASIPPVPSCSSRTPNPGSKIKMMITSNISLWGWSGKVSRSWNDGLPDLVGKKWKEKFAWPKHWKNKIRLIGRKEDEKPIASSCRQGALLLCFKRLHTNNLTLKMRIIEMTMTMRRTMVIVIYQEFNQDA